MLINERKTQIREYAEGMKVTIGDWQDCDYDDNRQPLPKGEKRLVITALNEGGHNGTDVDLLDVIEWVVANKPEIIEEIRAWNGGNKW